MATLLPLLMALVTPPSDQDRPALLPIEPISAGLAGRPLVEPHAAVHPSDSGRALVAAMQVTGTGHTDWLVVAFRREGGAGGR